MKNNKNIFAIILSTFILISCSDPNETVEEISNDNMKNYTNPFESEGRASSQSINPYEEIGVAHNAVLYDLEKVDVQSNMKEGYAQVVSFLSDNYGIDEEKFISYEEAEQDLNAAVNNGYEFYVSIKNSSKDDHVSEVLENLENIILFSTNSDVFNVKIDNLVKNVLYNRNLSELDKGKVLGTIALAKHSIQYWNTQSDDDIFDQDIIEKRRGKFWADVGGFIAGFVGGLVYNNNNGDGTDVNPFGTGVSVGSLASKAADKK